MKRLGKVSFTVEALHDTSNLFFDFIENNFRVIDIDHTDYEELGVIHMILEDMSDKFYFIKPCCNGDIYEYDIEVEIGVDELEFKVTIIN